MARKSDSERMALTTICLLLFVVRANEVVAKARIMLPDWVVCPEKEWIDIIPTQAGFDAKRFNQLIVNSNPKGANFGGEVHDGNKWGAVLTRGGYLVYTWGDPDYKYQSASLGKAFTWALIDLAVDEGLIKSDEPIWKSWNGKGQLSHPHKYLNHGYHKTPTWQHLLSLLVSTGGIWKGKRLISPEWIRSYVGGNGSLVAGDRETYISVGVVCARGLPSLKAFKDIIVGPVVVRKPERSQSGVSDPPRLPGGISEATATSDELLEPPSSLKNITVAKTAPVVDFFYYPGQTYKGNPWSNWGDGVATRGKYYSSIGDHKGPGGNTFVYEYDPKTKNLRCIVNLREVLSLPEEHYTPGKIHGRLDMGADGWLYFSTHRGSTRVTTDQYHYRGDWILRHHPKTGKTEIIEHGPVGKHCIPCCVLDPERLIFYGGTVAGDINDKRNIFFAYDIKARKLLYSGYNGPARYMIFAKSTGRVYFTPGLAGQLHRYDPRKGESPVGLGVEIGLRAATQETVQGFVYTVSKENAMLYRFDTRIEKVKQLGSAAIGSQTYITSIDADPMGRYLYYVPGAHGGSEKDGAAVVQFDVKTKEKKVIAFLHPFLKKRYGYTPLGTFSTAVDPVGDKLYITWNGNLSGSKRGRLTWDACALTVIHIPESERVP